jgi:hypothetical protein
MKRVFYIAILICSTFGANAQEQERGIQEKYFSAWGFSPFLHMGIGPGQVVNPAYMTSPQADTVCFVHQSYYIGIFSVSYEGRYNLFVPNDNLAVSVKGKPTLSFCSSNFGGIGGFYFPLGVGLEIGNGATYQTESNIGFTITAGYTFNMIPFTPGTPDDANEFDNVDLKSTWSCPYVAAGIRYWNKNNKLREINLFYGFGGKSDEIPAGVELAGYDRGVNEVPKKFDKSWMAAITWMIYINY